MARLLALAALVLLAWTGPAAAGLVAPSADAAALAVAPDGSPRVALVHGSELSIATRGADDVWTVGPSLRLRARGAALAGFAVDPRGQAVALVEDRGGRWLGLARQVAGAWRWTPLVRSLPAADRLGPAGLALDAAGSPAVAYAVWQPSRRTALFLARARPRAIAVERITRAGFPPSIVPPPAVPVRVGREVRVVEAYGADGTAATIEWARVGRVWWGQVLHTGVYSFPFGLAASAAAPDGTVYAAWTDYAAAFAEPLVLLAVHGRTVTSSIPLEHAALAGLALTAQGPELAANDVVAAGELGLPGSGVLWAGEVADGTGPLAELDGRILGFQVGPDWARHVLLESGSGVFWFRSPGRLATRVSLAASPAPDGSTVLSGRVPGTGSGAVAVYREQPGAARVLVGEVTIAPDGSFSLTDSAALTPSLYRAVYADPATGIPYAALIRPS